MKGKEYTKAEIERLWKWIDRYLDERFFETAGHIGNKLAEQRWDEIPKELKPTAMMIIGVAQTLNEKGIKGDADYSCLLFRTALYECYKKLKEEKGVDLFLPYGWYCDGPMINPEWIVRMTNGIVGYKCDIGSEICGMEGECRYFNIKNIKKCKKCGSDVYRRSGEGWPSRMKCERCGDYYDLSGGKR